MVVTAMASTKSKFSKKVKDTLDRLPEVQRNGLSANSKSILFDPEVEDLEPDDRGRFSVCLRKDLMSNKEYDDIVEEFSIAGEVVDVHMSETMVFIRFLSKEELQNCLRIFRSKYNLRLAKKKGDDRGFKGKSKTATYNGPREQRQTDGQESQEDENGRGSGSKISSNSSPWANSCNDLAESSTELFVSNIEDEEMFKRAVQKYKPKSVKVRSEGVKKYGFVSMSNLKDAAACIRDMHKQMQNTRTLYVSYNTRVRQNSGANGSDSSSLLSDLDDSPTSRKSRHSQQNGTHRDMPALETDYSDLPPLVKDSEIYDPEGKYNYDCGVLVTNFPPQTLESELKGVFKDYRVTDICVMNNGFAEGCTRAMVYMGTLYQAIQAIRSQHSYVLHGHTLDVTVPTNNILLKKILMRIETNFRDC